MVSLKSINDESNKRNSLRTWLWLAFLMGLVVVVLCLVVERAECRPKDDDGADRIESKGNKDNSDEKTASEKKKGDDKKKKNDDKRDDDKDKSKIEKKIEEKMENKMEENLDEKEGGNIKIKERKSEKKEDKSDKNEDELGKETEEKKKKDNDGKEKKHPKAHHRVRGGIKQDSVPPYLATLWQPSTAHLGTDGRYVGNGVLVGPEHVIMHHASKAKLDNTAENDPYQDPARPKRYENVIFSNPTRINVKDGISKKDLSRGIDTIKTGLGNSQFGLYKLPAKRPYGAQPLPNPIPKLEWDYNNYGTDCNAYAWSKNLNSGTPVGPATEGSRASDIEREFVKVPVRANPNSCRNGHCELTSNKGFFCDGLGDHGAPVLCGPQKKLTFMISGFNPAGNGCRRGKIPAFHVGSLYDDLHNLVPGIEQPGKRR